MSQPLLSGDSFHQTHLEHLLAAAAIVAQVEPTPVPTICLPPAGMASISTSLLLNATYVFAQNIPSCSRYPLSPCFSYRMAVINFIENRDSIGFTTNTEGLTKQARFYVLTNVFKRPIHFFMYEITGEEKRNEYTYIHLGQYCPSKCHVFVPPPVNLGLKTLVHLHP